MREVPIRFRLAWRRCVQMSLGLCLPYVPSMHQLGGLCHVADDSSSSKHLHAVSPPNRVSSRFLLSCSAGVASMVMLAAGWSLSLLYLACKRLKGHGKMVLLPMTISLGWQASWPGKTVFHPGVPDSFWSLDPGEGTKQMWPVFLAQGVMHK